MGLGADRLRRECCTLPYCRTWSKRHDSRATAGDRGACFTHRRSGHRHPQATLTPPPLPAGGPAAIGTAVADPVPPAATAHFDRGMAQYRQQQYRPAIAEFDQALDAWPAYPQAVFYRGAAYAHLGDRARALADYNRALQLNPDYALAYNNRGILYEDAGDDAQALADYSTARESHGASAPVDETPPEWASGMKENQGLL
jgi:tetratricopeptide (TPR) repeat protein